MSILIADSGSTKTDWRLIDADGRIHQDQTEGYNPYLVDTSTIASSIQKNLTESFQQANLREIYFYGAGCSVAEKKNLVAEALRTVFPSAKITIEHDLLGAARALCGRNAGMAAILGTGSNSCYYDGQQILENSPSLGWVFGDEGSGSALGRELVRRYLYKAWSNDIQDRITKRFELSRNEILDRIYKQPMPNRFLASFSKFIFQNIEQPEMSELVVQNFRQFFKQHIATYSRANEVPLHVTGSVGFYYSNLLRRVAAEFNVAIGQVTEMPIAGLCLYHHPEND